LADTLQRLIRAAEEFRRLDPDMPTQTALTLLTIASSPGLTVREVQERLGFAPSSASRNVAALSDRNRHGQPGLGLITYRVNPTDYRCKQLFLTPKGQRFINTVINILEG